MTVIRAKQFKGYSSKPDELINNPELGSVCTDMIINKGDLCNFPFIEKTIQTGGSASFIFNRAISVDESIDLKFVMIANSDEKIIVVDIDDNVPTLQLDVDNFINWASLDISKNTIFTKWIKSGIYYYLNGDTGDSIGNTLKQRMMRVKIESIIFQGNEVFVLTASLIGIMPPLFVEEIDDLGESTQPLSPGTYDFAFSFSIDTKGSVSQNNTRRLSENGIESNAIELKDVIVDGIIAPSFRIYLQLDQTGLERSSGPSIRNTHVNVFARRVSGGESVYKFLRSYALTVPVENSSSGNFSGLYYSDFLADGNVRNEDRNPSFIGKSVPWTCNHISEFGGRYYRDVVKQKYVSRTGSEGNTDIDIEVQSNIIQVGPSFIEESFGSGFVASDPNRAQSIGARHINYIDETLNFPVGIGLTTGIIEFLGQLIIFKQTETYVLTADIVDIKNGFGEQRLLWPDLGCVCKKSKGYIIINNILYFVAQDGIYAFSGQGRPIKISTLIEEDLLEESGYEKIHLSVHDRYDLLVVGFANLQNTSYIFHTEEGGAWTTLFSNIVVYQDSNRNYWENVGFILAKLKNINESTTFNETRFPRFTSGKMTLEDDVRNKQWKEFTLETLTKLATDKEYTVKFDSDTADAVVSKTDQILKRQHIGMYSPAIAVDITMLNEFIDHQPFRINGYSVTGIMKGRR